MIDRQDLRDLGLYLLAIAPAPIGALIGMRYAVDQTPRQRTLTWLCSCGLGWVGGTVIGERFGLSAAEVALATIVVGAVGMELVAGLVAIAKAFARDPFVVVDKVLDIVRRVLNRGQP